MTPHVDADHIASAMTASAEHGVGGLAWAVSDGGRVVSGAAGWLDPDDRATPMPVDGIFRIASVTKPITAVAALQLVDDGLIGLDDPVDAVLPELADRRVLVDPDGPIDGPTVAADRSLTLRDLLTFRCGWGMEFTTEETPPLLGRLWELGIGPGPKGPSCSPDEFMAHLAELPLADQPGTRWRYHVGSDIVTVLVERLRSARFDTVLAQRVLGPLAMHDTAFRVGPDRQRRFGAGRMRGDDGEWAVFDRADGEWSNEPPFCSGAAGLASTVGDLVAFGEMLLAGGIGPGGRLVSASLVQEMMSDHLTVAQRRTAMVDAVSTKLGWGLGGGVRREAADAGWPTPGTFGWDGGLGSHWLVDPATGITAVLLTTDAFSSPAAPTVMAEFDRAIAAGCS